MSAKVFSDLERRYVTNPFDLLPIAANSCDYAIRFDSKQLVNTKDSRNLYALMMYVPEKRVVLRIRSTSRRQTSHLVEELQICSTDPYVSGIKDPRLFMEGV